MKIGGIPIRKKGKFEQSRAPQKPSMAEQQVNKPAKQPRQSGGKKGWIIALALVAIVVLGVCSYGFVLKNQDAIYPNVYVAGVNVGGLKRDAAISAVSEAVQTSYESDTLNVVLPDRTLSLTPEVTQVALNPEQAIDEAMRYGRSGGPISAVVHYLRAGSSEYSVDLDSSLNLDTTYIRTLVDQTARECASDKIDPIVKVDEAAGTITITAGSPAVSLDADKLYDAVIARFTAGDFSALDFDYDTVPCESVDLQQYYDKYCKEMTDAYYDEEKKELVPEVNGYGFDLPYYTQQLAMADPGTKIVIQAEAIQPEVTLAELEKEYFSDVLGSCDSPHTAQAGRTKNLELACKAIDGTILNPGDEFSFNKIVGERTPEKGYQSAIVYQTGGKSEAEAVGSLLNLVQTGLEYKFDKEVWGVEDRAFFAEETLFYPYCDCEDRAILLTRFVRDLLGLECVLIYYPGHMACAVHFSEPVDGDYYTYGEKDFTVCDPTYIGAPIGRQMPDFADKEATLIPIKTK